jgi:hypothetical protein
MLVDKNPGILIAISIMFMVFMCDSICDIIDEIDAKRGFLFKKSHVKFMWSTIAVASVFFISLFVQVGIFILMNHAYNQ